MDEMNFSQGDILAFFESDAVSWTYVVLFALFFITCIRVKGNFKFVTTFFRDMVEVRERDNMLDATVRETSFIFFSLLISGCSLGVLLRHAVPLFGASVRVRPDLPSFGIMALGEIGAEAVCIGLACGYIGVMWICYGVVGRVFSDSQHAWQWVRGFTSGTGLGTVAFFPLALLVLAYPQYAREIVLLALCVLILVKIVFVVKGFRIFFTESSLWVVFLYYLCSLEIVPLVATFGLACELLG